MPTRPAGLGAAPRLRLAVLPTPLLPAPRLSGALGVELWVKRDDLTGVGLGGNDVRKLEYLLGDARAWGADVVVTGGGPGSDHVRVTAAAAASTGLGCVVVCRGRPPATEPPDLVFTRRTGAEVRFTGDPNPDSVEAGVDAAVAGLERDGRRPYRIRRGGATPVGCLGYVSAAFELEDQLRAAGVAPAAVVLATGSGCTQAGLLLGAALAGCGWSILGVAVGHPPARCAEGIGALARATAALLAVEVDPTGVVVMDGTGPGDGTGPPPAGVAAAELAARREGPFLDPAGTAGALGVLAAEVRAGRIGGPVVLLHTGGLGGLGVGGPATGRSRR